MSSELDKTNASAFDYSQSATPLILALSEPFLNTFGLTTIIYLRIFHDGRYLLLSNQINWVKNWLQNTPTIENTLLQNILKNVPLGEPYYFLWSTAPPDKLMKMHNSFGIWHGFDIHYRLEDSIETWAFCTSAEQEKINNFYLNNLKLFHGFCLHFREKAAFLLDISDKKHLASFKSSFDISFHPLVSFAEETTTLSSSLLHEGYSLRTHNGPIKISKREVECILYLAQDKSIKEIGRLLNISPRTVETYITASKRKTGHHNKSGLIDAFRNDLIKWL